jgi:outer membrane protein OmpA-like peptidoglycan-associated protein
MRNLVLILSLLLWAFFGWKFNSDCKKCSASVGDSVSSAPVSTTAATTTDQGPLLYKYNAGDAITNDKWPARKAEILAALKDSQKLEITGLYRSDEVNNTSFENLGLARADAARKLLTELPDDRVILSSRLVDGASDKTNPFESCDFDYRIVTSTIKETADKTIIRFPFNSTNKLNSTEVEAYLDDVAERVKASGEGISLVGHTDNVGDDASNMALGQRRADIVKAYLVQKGVPADKINSTSQGESQPIADNNTDAGRQENRRTELQIIK